MLKILEDIKQKEKEVRETTDTAILSIFCSYEEIKLLESLGAIVLDTNCRYRDGSKYTISYPKKTWINCSDDYLAMFDTGVLSISKTNIILPTIPPKCLITSIAIRCSIVPLKFNYLEVYEKFLKGDATLLSKELMPVDPVTKNLFKKTRKSQITAI